MNALLSFHDNQPFATGAVDYWYAPATISDTTSRILLPIKIEGIPVNAILDTGAPYVVCDPELAGLLKLDPTTALGTERLLVRGYWVTGYLYRLDIAFPADQGATLTVVATVFVPDATSRQSWGHWPSFVGLSGCLERMRFAIDPATDTFYFGPL